MPRTGKQMLQYEVDGVWLESQVPASFGQGVMKKPAAKKPAGVAKKPAEAQREDPDDEEEQDNEEGEEEQAEEDEEQNDDDEEEGEEEEAEQDEPGKAEGKIEQEGTKDEAEDMQPDEEGEEEEPKQEDEEIEAMDGEGDKGQASKKSKKRSVLEMAKEKDNPKVHSTIFCRALTGKNIRAYILAKMGEKKQQLCQISKQESPKYESLVKSLQKTIDAKVKAGITFNELKDLAKMKKKTLLP